MTRRFLEDAYGHESGDAARHFYDEWASSYDQEIAENGYATPGRCAAALSQFSYDMSRPILDLGCGTGLSGAALRLAGFKTIDGWDPSQKMLRQAEARHVYRVLRHIDPDAPLSAPHNAYIAVNAAGVMSPGLAPPEAFDQMLAFLPQGGLICYSLNDHAIEDGAHKAHVDELVRQKAVSMVFEEYGDHLPGKGMKSFVHVLRKG